MSLVSVLVWLKLLTCLSNVTVRNPHATADIFARLKRGRAEPVAEAARGIGVGQRAIHADRAYNVTPRDVLSKLPGVTDVRAVCGAACL